MQHNEIYFDGYSSRICGVYKNGCLKKLGNGFAEIKSEYKSEGTST